MTHCLFPHLTNLVSLGIPGGDGGVPAPSCLATIPSGEVIAELTSMDCSKSAVTHARVTAHAKIPNIANFAIARSEKYSFG
jgi:hypothetical protein